MGKHWFQHFSGKRLKAFREKRGWSQDDLAARVGTSRSAISTYEHDSRKPRVEMVVRLASAFGIKPRDLLDDVDDDALDMADLRYLQGLRQPEVAARLGIPAVTYQRIEARRAQIEAERLQEMAEILGTTSGSSAAKLDVPPSH